MAGGYVNVWLNIKITDGGFVLTQFGCVTH